MTQIEIMGYPVTDPEGNGGPNPVFVAILTIVFLSILATITYFVNKGMIQ